MVAIVPLRQSHILAVSGTTSPWPFVGVAGVDETGRVLGLGAIVHQDGHCIATFHAEEGEAERHKLTLLKASRRFLAAAKALGIRVVAQCDGSVPGSRTFMEHLGFRPTGGMLGDEPEWVLE